MLKVKYAARPSDQAEAELEIVGGSIASAGPPGTVNEIITVEHGHPQSCFRLSIGSGSLTDLDLAAKGLAARAKALPFIWRLVLKDPGHSSIDVPALVRLIAVHGWSFEGYSTNAKAKDSVLTIVEHGHVHAQSAAEALVVADAINFARMLILEPPNLLTPADFVVRAAELSELGVKQSALDEEAMRKLGMQALLNVAKGSTQPPRLLIMRWDGDPDPEARSVAIVGKGVCFDSGGLSLKNAIGMMRMKADMAGAAVITAVIRAAANLQLPINIVGVCGLVENMPDGKACRPGDVVTSMSGQTIEVLNTDSEGRLVLADCLTWIQQNCEIDYLIDVATLTGSVVTALGDTRELQCAASDVVALRTRSAGPAGTGAVTMADLVRSTLRLRPDRIIVGEVRGKEALDMLKAWNTGHPGGIATVHANSAQAALYRLEQLVQESVVTVPRRLIAEAIDMIVFISGRGLARRVSGVARVAGLDAQGNYAVLDLNPDLTGEDPCA